MNKRAKVTQPLSALGSEALEQVAAALELAHAEARAREETLPSEAPALPTDEWQGTLARIDECMSGMAHRLNDVAERMGELAAFLEGEEHACQAWRAAVQGVGEKFTKMAAHSVS